MKEKKTKIKKRQIIVEDLALDAAGQDEKIRFIGSDGLPHEGTKINSAHIPVTSDLVAIFPGATNVSSVLKALWGKFKKSGGKASLTDAGAVKLASKAEVKGMLNNDKAVTPLGLSALKATSNNMGMVKVATAEDLAKPTASNRDNVIPLALKEELIWETGSIRLWILPNIPAGWQSLNGQLLSRSQHSVLWNSVKNHAVPDSEWHAGKYTFFSTGDNSTNFRLPRLAGLVPRGLDQGAGVDPDASSRIGGNVLLSRQDDEFKAHTHKYNNRATSVSRKSSSSWAWHGDKAVNSSFKNHSILRMQSNSRSFMSIFIFSKKDYLKSKPTLTKI